MSNWLTRLRRFYWQHRKHSHNMHNERLVDIGPVVCGRVERNGDLIEVQGYVVECVKCGAVYGVPVG